MQTDRSYRGKQKIIIQKMINTHNERDILRMTSTKGLLWEDLMY